MTSSFSSERWFQGVSMLRTPLEPGNWFVLLVIYIDTEWFGPLSLGNRSFLDAIVVSTDLNESDYNDSSIFIQYDLEKISISNRLSPFSILKRLLSRKSSHFFHRPREKFEKYSKNKSENIYFYETKI